MAWQKVDKYWFFVCQREKTSLFGFSGPITFTYDGHGYFYSGDVEAHAEDKVDWLEARNICREYCMDLVSIETPSENDLIEELIKGGKKSFIRAALLISSLEDFHLEFSFIFRWLGLHLDFGTFVQFQRLWSWWFATCQCQRLVLVWIRCQDGSHQLYSSWLVLPTLVWHRSQNSIQQWC